MDCDYKSYVIILFLEKNRILNIGKLGKIFFKSGFYVYCGSAKKNIKQRIKRHAKAFKRHHWHVDYLRQYCKFIDSFIADGTKTECEISKKLKDISENSILGFGCSDCNCISHLYYFNTNPIYSIQFQHMILNLSMKRLKD
ncbi:GIY-YIG nuclease family protein [Thermodesulfobium sp.]|jgi:sugar fermentation stimulation protein A